MGDLAVAAAARPERHAPDPGRRIAHPGERLGDLGGGLEARDHQPVRAQVERPADPQPLGRRDPHDRGGRRALDGEQLGVEVGLGAHAVLEVDSAQSNPARATSSAATTEPRLTNAPIVGSPGQHAAAQVGARREGRDGGGGLIGVGHGPMMPDRGQPLRPRASTGPVLDAPVRLHRGERRHEVDDRADVVRDDRDDRSRARGGGAPARAATRPVVVVQRAR